MEQRERNLSAAEKERYFPGINWSGEFAFLAGAAIITGGLASLPVFVVWQFLFSYGPYQWLPWLPFDGYFVIWWICVPVALLAFGATYCRDVLWQLRQKQSACDSVIVELHHVADAIMVREMEHGTPAYFILTDDDRVFFVNRGSDVYNDGWETDPVSVSKPDCVRRTYERMLNGTTLSELDEAFSGEAMTMDRCYTTDLRWDRISPEPQVRWEDIIEKFELEPVEVVNF